MPRCKLSWRHWYWSKSDLTLMPSVQKKDLAAEKRKSNKKTKIFTEVKLKKKVEELQKELETKLAELEDLRKREGKLNEREKQIDRREASLQAQTGTLGSAGKGTRRRDTLALAVPAQREEQETLQAPLLEQLQKQLRLPQERQDLQEQQQQLRQSQHVQPQPIQLQSVQLQQLQQLQPPVQHMQHTPMQHMQAMPQTMPQPHMLHQMQPVHQHAQLPLPSFILPPNYWAYSR